MAGWNPETEIVVPRHAVQRTQERAGIRGMEAVRFLTRRVERAIKDGALSPVPPGWVLWGGKQSPRQMWIETYTEHKIAILVRLIDEKIFVITVMAP